MWTKSEQVVSIKPCNFAGIFNVSNKLFITLDVPFEMRSHIQRGEPPHNCMEAVFEVQLLTGRESQHRRNVIQDKLYNGTLLLKH